MIIAVAGGKGGVGKTIIAVNIALLLRDRGRVMLVDADADNPCVEPTLRSVGVTIENVEEVHRYRPKILEDKCDLCGRCVEVCPEHAIIIIPGQRIMIVDTLCAGCGCCSIVCDRKAVQEEKVLEGYIKRGRAANMDLLISELKPGEKRSYVVMTKMMETYRGELKRYDYVIVDSPPGTGAGVFSILKNSDVHIIVTEASRLGLADFRKIMKLKEEKLPQKKTIVIVNKYDLNLEVTDEIERYCRERNIPVVKIPYSDNIARLYMTGRPVVLENVEEKKFFEEILRRVVS